MLTYTNPVYSLYMADPFILQYKDVFYAYGTAPTAHNGEQFPILLSENLIDWQLCGHALHSLEGFSTYWAPEVVCHEEKFYMYYSAGNGDKGHHIRVATSVSPDTPFSDSGRVLTPNLPFAIDAHPFQDIDGEWYLFYAHDFLTSNGDYRIGTGIVVDKMLDMFTLEGNPKLVVRPFADWHLFEADRKMYGKAYDWYTLEGPSVRVHNGQFYCFYSGGAWERENYGVSYVVADHPMGPYRRPTHLDGAIFQSIDPHVYGPGHNSFVTLDNGDEYIVYHAWNSEKTARLMCIDRLTWQDKRPQLHGPTWLPQLVPMVSKKGAP
jgi:GH43 family beta-xylosidase